MPEHNSGGIPTQVEMEALATRVRKVELENLQLRTQQLFIQLVLLEHERGREVEASDPDAAVIWEQLRVLRDRIEAWE